MFCSCVINLNQVYQVFALKHHKVFKGAEVFSTNPPFQGINKE
jgi:hypothetical protein